MKAGGQFPFGVIFVEILARTTDATDGEKGGVLARQTIHPPLWLFYGARAAFARRAFGNPSLVQVLVPVVLICRGAGMCWPGLAQILRQSRP